MPVLFCKYFRNKSSDLHEILCGGQLLSCELTQLFKLAIEWLYYISVVDRSAKNLFLRSFPAIYH